MYLAIVRGAVSHRHTVIAVGERGLAWGAAYIANLVKMLDDHDVHVAGCTFSVTCHCEGKCELESE